ncbi:PEP-CTERM sorting domain-containing protein [Akkermansiaceae bacterium]|nr:PEP-CTERM sorting domain-containing protein [Akkermansiaceae bacterium]
MKPYIAALAAFSLFGASANAALVSQLGILDLNANGGINPNTGVAWQANDQYRLAFWTIGTITATSNDPAFYDNFATAQAQLSTLGNGNIQTSTGWTALAWVNTDFNQNQGLALSSPLVRSGTNDFTGGAAAGGAGVPVYAMDGMTAIARNNNDIWNNWSNPFANSLNGQPADSTIRLTSAQTGNGQTVYYSPFLDQNGGGDTGINHGVDAWTGGFNGHVNALGDTIDNTTSSYGSTNANNPGRVYNRFTGNNTDSRKVYVLSPLLTVTDAIPEPSTALLGALGMLALFRRRR